MSSTLVGRAMVKKYYADPGPLPKDFNYGNGHGDNDPAKCIHCDKDLAYVRMGDWVHRTGEIECYQTYEVPPSPYEPEISDTLIHVGWYCIGKSLMGLSYIDPDNVPDGWQKIYVLLKEEQWPPKQSPSLWKKYLQRVITGRWLNR